MVLRRSGALHASPRARSAPTSTARSPARRTSAASACWSPWKARATRPCSSDLGREIALHAAATSPLSLSVDDLDPAAVEREKAIFTEQAIASGKPPQVAEKMVEGRIRKFYEEAVLLKQAYVREPEITVEQLVARAAKESGAPAKVNGFVRLALGEGVEKKDGGDFAAEVAAMTGAELKAPSCRARSSPGRSDRLRERDPPAGDGRYAAHACACRRDAAPLSARARHGHQLAWSIARVLKSRPQRGPLDEPRLTPTITPDHAPPPTAGSCSRCPARC